MVMHEAKDIEKIVEEIVERKLDLIVKILKGSLLSDVATKSDLKLLMEMMDKRFEAIDKRFEAMEKRFELMDKRFETTDRRFDAMEKRFDDLIHYTDKKFDVLLKIIFSFNIPILMGIIAMLLKMFFTQ